MLKNQLKVLLQRVYTGNRRPAKILMSTGMRDALRLEMLGCGTDYVQQTFPREDRFHGIPIVLAPGVVEPIIELEPEDNGPKELQVKDLL